MKEVWPL